MLQPGAVPTKVVCLTQVVTADELKDDEEYEDILEDMRTEGGKFGKYLEFCFPTWPFLFNLVNVVAYLLIFFIFFVLCICLFYSLL